MHAKEIMRELYQESPNLWQGSAASMMRVVPYAALTYAVYELLQPAAERLTYSAKPTVLSRFVAGATASAAATVIVYPLDLMRTRNATATSPQYSSYYNGMRSMLRSGGIRALYEGLLPSLVGTASMGGIGFATYGFLKDWLQIESFVELLAAGAAAGVAAQVVTYPLNVLKRQAQVENAIYDGFVRSMRTMYRRHGLYSACYQRMPYGWAMGALTVGVSFAVYDVCKESVIRAKKELRQTALPSFAQLVAPPN
jgi:solute carrier family 25 protein 42